MIDGVRKDAPTLAIEFSVSAMATNVRCDTHLMETLIRNLLYNAIRYARNRVRLTFGIDADRYSLCVEDDGPGIPEHDRERVFASFVQLQQPGATKQGFGLGLAIVKRIAEWHGGNAACTASELGGAKFTVTWPAA